MSTDSEQCYGLFGVLSSATVQLTLWLTQAAPCRHCQRRYGYRSALTDLSPDWHSNRQYFFSSLRLPTGSEGSGFLIVLVPLFSPPLLLRFLLRWSWRCGASGALLRTQLRTCRGGMWASGSMRSSRRNWVSSFLMVVGSASNSMRV